MKGIVSSKAPPDFLSGINYWERGPDPWHSTAFPEEYKVSSPHPGKRILGWFGIDWAENAVVFIPDDGTMELAGEFELKDGPCLRPCAYRVIAEPKISANNEEV